MWNELHISIVWLDMLGIPPIVFATGSRDRIYIQHAAFVQHSDWEGPGWITPHIPPQEPVRPRQDKHAAEKEKPGVPKEHTERHTDNSMSPILCQDNFKTDCSKKSLWRHLDCLFSLIACPVGFIHPTQFYQEAKKEELPGSARYVNKTCYELTSFGV